MSPEYTTLTLRISRRDMKSGLYEVEADLDDETHFERGSLLLNVEDLLEKELDSKTYGLELFDALFQGPVLRAYQQAWQGTLRHK